jgi:hypothetical protein
MDFRFESLKVIIQWFLPCLSFAERKFGVGLVRQCGCTRLGRHQPLRVNRPNDRPAWISFVGCLLWMGIVGAFAATLPNPIDLRPLYHLVVTLILAALSLRTALRR